MIVLLNGIVLQRATLCVHVCVCSCVCACVCVSHSVMYNSLQLHGLLPTRLFCPWDSPGKDTVV